MLIVMFGSLVWLNIVMFVLCLFILILFDNYVEIFYLRCNRFRSLFCLVRDIMMFFVWCFDDLFRCLFVQKFIIDQVIVFVLMQLFYDFFDSLDLGLDDKFGKMNFLWFLLKDIFIYIIFFLVLVEDRIILEELVYLVCLFKY